MKTLMTVQEASKLILAGKKMIIAGDENLLAKLPHGEWIGGTIPYFMSENGGLHTQEQVQAAVLPDVAVSANIRAYGEGELERIPADYASHGFSYVLIPAFTGTHKKFAQYCSTWPGVFDRPLVGWIAGVNVQDIGKILPKTVNGKNGEISPSNAVVMHVELPANTIAKAYIINLFSQSNGDTITFPASGFEVTECTINGKPQSLAGYIVSQKIDQKLPLVADYMGAMVNVSIQAVDTTGGKVSFYAPVFQGIEYKFALPVADYEAAFLEKLGSRQIHPVFSCNCILNYLYAHLEGKKTGDIVGPMTFGEIAYMLLNQTMVYLTIEPKA